VTLPPTPPGLPHWTWAELAVELRAGIGNAITQIERIHGNPALRNSEWGREAVRMWINKARDWRRGLQAIRTAGYTSISSNVSVTGAVEGIFQVPATASAAPTYGVPVTTAAAESQAVAAQRAAAQTAKSSSRLRWLAGSPAVAVTMVAVLAIVAVGLYAQSRQSSVIERSRLFSSGPDPEERFIGPKPPDDTCIGDTAGQHGLLWTADWGWRAPDADPEPALYLDDKYPDDEVGYADYLVDYDEWELRLRTRVATTLAEAAAECGAPRASRPVPGADVLCGFFPGSLVGGIPRTAAINDSPAMLSACIYRDGSGGEGPLVWAELYTVDESQVSAEEAAHTVRVSQFGPSRDLSIGDGAWVVEHAKNHVMVGTVGPVMYVLYACSECAGTMVGDLESIATHITDAYLAWEAGQT